MKKYIYEVMENKANYCEENEEYYKVPNWLWQGLTALGCNVYEKAVYECFMRYANNSKNLVRPSYNRISEFTSIGSKTTIKKALDGLKRKGLIRIVHIGTTQGDSNVYEINQVVRKEIINME